MQKNYRFASKAKALSTPAKIIAFLKYIIVLFICALILSLSFFTIHGRADDNSSVLDVLKADANFSIFVKAINQIPSLSDQLKNISTGEYTVFVPKNAAFEKLNPELLNRLLLPENAEALSKILNYHIQNIKNNGAKIVTATSLKTIDGSDITVKLTNTQILLNQNVNLSKIDISAKNGIIHVIDDILVPSSVNLDTLKGNGNGNENNKSEEKIPEATKTDIITTSPLMTTPRSGGVGEISIVFVIATFVTYLYSINKKSKLQAQ
jgi:uncharacterized surface protein with fasciclin (FAS1) repeats